MRISDWSSDVCSSDLLTRIQRISPYGEVRGQSLAEKIDQVLRPDRELGGCCRRISVRIFRRSGGNCCRPHCLGVAYGAHELLIQKRMVLWFIAQPDAQPSPLPVPLRYEISNVVHLANLDLTPQVQRGQYADPRKTGRAHV